LLKLLSLHLCAFAFNFFNETKTMKIALFGYGKMGKLVHNVAQARNHSIVSMIDSKTSCSTELLKQADVCIDFSTPQAVLKHVKLAASLKKNIVIGTTGWHEELKEVNDIVRESSIGLLHAPNFSLGIALFLKIIEQTAKVMSPFGQYEVGGIEMHHAEKKDSPSGTAKAIESRLNQPITFSTVRVGHIPGTHSVIYDSPADSITLTHTARSREGFAEGAIRAAEWVEGKKGIFTLDDLLREIYL
jgi:4-hydroxy-tetrahydrodipicolinate reductase